MDSLIELVPIPFLENLGKNNVIPFIGAGFSKNAEIPEGMTMPSWDELGRIIANKIDGYEYEDAVDAFSCYEWKYSKEQLIADIRTSLNIGKVKAGNVHTVLFEIFKSDIMMLGSKGPN